MYRLTRRGQELFGGESGEPVSIDELRQAIDANPDWSITPDGEPVVDEIRYNGEVVAIDEDEDAE